MIKEPTIITHKGESGFFVFCRECGMQSAVIDYDGLYYCFDHFLKKAEEEFEYKNEIEREELDSAESHYHDLSIMQARGK